MDVYQPAGVKSCYIASAAEDRSVVVWSSSLGSICSEHPHPFRKWGILYRLDSRNLNNSTQSLLFEARIWTVRMCDWGLATAGEDCSIVYCPWSDSPNEKLKPILLKSVHRGRSIWCLDVRIFNATEMKIVECYFDNFFNLV